MLRKRDPPTTLVPSVTLRTLKDSSQVTFKSTSTTRTSTLTVRSRRLIQTTRSTFIILSTKTTRTRTMKTFFNHRLDRAAKSAWKSTRNILTSALIKSSACAKRFSRKTISRNLRRSCGVFRPRIT